MTRRIVRSWDVFDTLIARRCGHAEAIFDLMGAVLGHTFSAARVQAERAARLSKREITLDDIYDELQRVLGWSEEDRQRAFDLEVQTEVDNVIPVMENLSRVKAGDIAVSDMYLAPETIGALLRTAGLDNDIAVFVSNNGKGDGSMWKQLRKQFFILRHTGDNAHSDFLRPLRHGIPARLTEASAETAWERVLRCNGAPALSAYVREMRLRAIDVNVTTRDVRRAQIEGNLPLLLFASAALVRWCDEHGFVRALMCSRDCVLWTPLAEKVARHAGSPLVVEYFLISRVAALDSSDRYLEYAARRIKPNSIVVDLSMTGTSLAGLADRLGIDRVHAFVIAWHQSLARSLYGERHRPKAKVDIEFLTAEVIDDDLEAINQALTPSIHDAEETEVGLSVTYGSENRAKAVLEAVRVQHAAFSALVDRLPGPVIEEALALARSPRLVFFVRECARRAGQFETVISRARPGAALWNDPNAIKLNLPYASRLPVMHWLVGATRRLLKPLLPPGSFLHALGKSSGLIVKALRKPRHP
jgi:hypothetical protein